MADVAMPQATRAERRKARTEAAILAAGERLFHERGFRDTRIEDLAALADVAVGSIYSHFGSKLGLFLAVVDDALAAQEQVFAAIHASTLPPVDKLRALGAAYVDFALTNPSKFRLLSEGPLTPGGPSNPELAARLEQLGRRGEALIDALAATIQQGVETRQMRPVDPATSARFLWAAWSGALALHLRYDRLGATDPTQMRAIVEQGADIVSFGLRAQPPYPDLPASLT